MKIIITGATGLIGRALSRQLLERGHEVEAWTRDPARARPLLPDQCTVTAWNPTDIDPEALTGADVVVHLAGENIADKRWSDARKKALQSSRIDSSRALVAAIGALAPESRPGHLVSASAIGIYGDRGDESLTEDAPAGEGFLPQLCADWEEAIFAADGLGVRTAALRIGVVLDPSDGMLATVLPLFRLGVGGRLGSGRQWFSWIHVDDVVGLFVHAIENENVRGPVNAAAPNPVQNSEMTRQLARAVRRPAIFPVPLFGLRLAFGEMSSILVGSQKLVPARALETGFTFAHPTLEGAFRDLLVDGPSSSAG